MRWLIAPLCLLAQSLVADQLPNILIIYADDLGYGDVGCYNPESSIPTPNLDKMAEEGMLFTDAHCAATACTPSRYSLLTGRMAFRTGYHGVFVSPEGPCLIEQDRLTLPQMLKDKGYATAAVGKWHLGMTMFNGKGEVVKEERVKGVQSVDYSYRIPDGPVDRGFDYFFGTACCPTTDCQYAFIDNDRIPNPPTQLFDLKQSDYPQTPFSYDCKIGMKADDFDFETVDLVFLEKSKAYLEQHIAENPDQPFFLYHAMQAVHLPSLPADQFKGKTSLGAHADFIFEMDYIVGELLATLERLGVDDNTLVIFGSDNGPEAYTTYQMRTLHDHDPAKPWRGMKRDQWDGGHRTPFIIRWPAKVPAGRVTDQLFSQVDIMATCANIIGTTLPDDAGEDSYDMLSVFMGKDGGEPVRPYLLQQAVRNNLSIRHGKWKYLDHQGSGGNDYVKREYLNQYILEDTDPDAPGQLYDLERDPGETQNLYSKHPEIVKHLKSKIDEYVANGRSAPLASEVGETKASFDPYANETQEEKAARMAWWRDARFGMFIHWGVYAVPAGVYHGEEIPGIGEWIMSARIPVDEYKAFARGFNPDKYNPNEWAALAKEAGMRYMVITSKHHDGFAMFPSDVTDWDIADASPYGKDLIAPLADAARAEGLKFGLYFSQAQDWVHPGGIKRRGVWDEAQRGDVDEYFDDIAVPQTREILSRYQPDVLWWDTPETTTQMQADKLAALVALVPGIITNNRLGGNYVGDTETPEQFIPPTGFKDRDFEVCMTMNRTWGYKSWDHEWKSTTEIIQKLCDIASKGGNFLLNIGPKADGTIPQPSIDRLKEVGAWMKVNGEAIYGTTASLFGMYRWGRATVKMLDEGATVYLHVFDWPESGKLEVPGFGSEPSSITLMAGSQLLTSSPFDKDQGKGITIDVPLDAPDPHASVIKIEVQGKVDFEKVRPRQGADGSLRLIPSDAYFHSNSKNALKVETIDGQENIGNWLADKSWVYWEFTVTKPGSFTLTSEVATASDVAFTYQLKDGVNTVASEAPEDGHKIYAAEEFASLEGYDKIEVEVSATDSEDEFEALELGTLDIKKPGVYVLEIRPVKDKWEATRLRSIELKYSENADGKTADGNSDASFKPVVIHKDIGSGSPVTIGSDGKLVYHPYTDKGDKVIDFSYCGYKASEEPIPDIPTVISLDPLSGVGQPNGTMKYPRGPDSLARIQDALDKVAAMEPAENGYRGAVVLTKGTYYVNGCLKVSSGVVLRGEGDGSDGTVLIFKNPKGVGISLGKEVVVEKLGDPIPIADAYVPAGTFELSVADASTLSVGDHIHITKIVNDDWVKTLGMDFPQGPKPGRRLTPWKPSAYRIDHLRQITSIDGNRLHLDVPLPQSFAKEFGGGVVTKVDASGVESLMGVEKLRVVSNYDTSVTDMTRADAPYEADEENNLHTGILFKCIQSWARNCTILHTSMRSVGMQDSRYITVRDCQSLKPISVIRGTRRYSFSNSDSSMILVYKCYAEDGRHDFVTGSRDTGPIAFVKGRTEGANAPSETHQRWASGVLFDCIVMKNGGGIAGGNRGEAGSGQGWSGVNVVIWNCIAPFIKVDNPPTSEQNFAIGCTAEAPPEAQWKDVSGDGYKFSIGKPVEPQSLFEQQLIERIGLDKVNKIL